MLGALAPELISLRPHSARQDKLVFIQNGFVKLGINLSLGGSITYLAPVDQPDKNVVNSFDWGRQIQLSFYSGPVPYLPNGAKVSNAWVGLGWNPIQSGDAFGNRAKVLAYHADRDRLYVKCIPMHWPLNNVPGECEFEVWLQLDGKTVKAHCRLTNKRDDLTQYPARTQELPAVYVNAPYHHLMTYTGSEPFTQAPTTEIHDRLDIDHRWATWLTTESWAAQVDDDDWGLGIWTPDTNRISGGFFSQPGNGGPKDAPTGYLAPNRNEILDHNIVYDFRYVLILGQLKEIRTYAVSHLKERTLPSWSFDRTRAGWYYENATDTGWPIKGGLNFKVGDQPVALLSPEFALPSSKIRSIAIDASLSGSARTISVYWKGPDTNFALAGESSVVPDGKSWTYTIAIVGLSKNQIVSQFRIEIKNGSPESLVRIHRITVR